AAAIDLPPTQTPHGGARMKTSARITLSFLLALLATSFTHAGEKITYIHNDALGSPVAATNQQGQVIWRETYRPHGQRTTNAAASANNKVWFTGKQEESALGINYFGARWYHPEVGRFLVIDPVGVSPDNIHSFNRYGYANNNPYGFVEPDGRAPRQRSFSPLDGGGGMGGGAARGAGGYGGRSGSGVSSAPKTPQARGVEAEGRVLKELGLPKNNQKVGTSEGKSIPDALTSSKSIEIKDSACVACTKQVRIQTDAAREAGRESVLITGEKTHVTRQAERAFGRDNIIRRKDLGPQ